MLQELGSQAILVMVRWYSHPGRSHVAQWAGNSTAAPGTNPAQAAAGDQTKNAPDGASSEGDQVGWLMGLEPTTTGITILDSTN